MALLTGFRPRSAAERLALGKTLRGNARRVRICSDDDGWQALHVRIAGKVPVWESGDPARCDAVLRRFGFAPMGDPEPLAKVEGPLVSIVICTYNRYGLLTEAIASALMQSHSCEVIVVDDGSTDGTWDLLQCFDGIRCVRLPENRGKATALDAGVAIANGEYLLVFDDDDLLLPGSVQVLAAALSESPDLIGVFGDALRFEDGDITRWRPSTRVPAEVLGRGLLNQVPGLTGAFLCRTEAWRAAGSVDPRLTRGEDMDMWLRLSRIGRMETLPVATFVHRMHDGLRGSAEVRWRQSDRTHEQRTLDYIAPVFRERWLQFAPQARRAEGHAWALGLKQRGLLDEAREELSRWRGPHTEDERWIREQCGLPSTARASSGAVVLVDEGDPGALALTLSRQDPSLVRLVALEVPRDPIGEVQLHWPGVYARKVDLASLLAEHPGPWHLRLASAPDWTPPPFDHASWLPPLAPIDAVLCCAAALGWSQPDRVRLGLRTELDPRTRCAITARRLLELGQAGRALHLTSRLLEALPAWEGGWAMAAQCFEAVGAYAEAQSCRARLTG